MEQKLGTIQTYGTLSGYLYLHIPQYVCRVFNIKPKTTFVITYTGSGLVLEQEVGNATVVGVGTAEAK